MFFRFVNEDYETTCLFPYPAKVTLNPNGNELLFQAVDYIHSAEYPSKADMVKAFDLLCERIKKAREDNDVFVLVPTETDVAEENQEDTREEACQHFAGWLIGAYGSTPNVWRPLADVTERYPRSVPDIGDFQAWLKESKLDNIALVSTEKGVLFKVLCFSSDGY